MFTSSSNLQNGSATMPQDGVHITALIVIGAGLLFALISRYAVLPVRKVVARDGRKLQSVLPTHTRELRTHNSGMSDDALELASFVLMWLTFLIGCGVVLRFEDGFWQSDAIAFAAILPFALIAFRWFWRAMRRPSRRVRLEEENETKFEEGMFYLAQDVKRLSPDMIF